jgi:hypothetical protein
VTVPGWQRASPSLREYRQQSGHGEGAFLGHVTENISPWEQLVKLISSSI